MKPLREIAAKVLPNLLLGLIILSGCKDVSKNQSGTKKTTDSVEIVVDLAISDYEISMQQQGLVNIQELDSTILVDLKYSTTDNFFGEDVYGLLSNAYLQGETAKALANSNKALREINKNYCLVVYDAARPLSVQKILWEKLDSIPPKKRKDFVADPMEGSIHNFGCAVDLSIFDLSQKQDLDMGTKYDYFGYLAFPRMENQMLREGKLSKEQVSNRQLLRKVMKAGGFEGITSEWWHFNHHSRNRAKQLYNIIE